MYPVKFVSFLSMQKSCDVAESQWISVTVSEVDSSSQLVQ